MALKVEHYKNSDKTFVKARYFCNKPGVHTIPVKDVLHS